MRLLFIACILGVFSCVNNNKKNPDAANIVHLPNEKWTIYNLEDTVVHIKRLLSSDTGLILLSYDINISEPEAARQTLINAKFLSDEQQANKIKLDSTKFKWTPHKDTPTLFVQIAGSVFKDEYEAILKRQVIEKNIETALKSNRLGKWTGGDVGPGGANMLFEVHDIDKALSIMLEVLQQSGFDKKTIIGRRINTDVDDWFYEVIYPIHFSGEFITM